MIKRYKFEYVLGVGYVVWRDTRNEPDMAEYVCKERILLHKVAVFVCESEAEFYCQKRNAITDEELYNAK